MVTHRKVWIAGIIVLTLACLEIVFQPIQRAPAIREFEIRYQADVDVKKLVNKNESFDEVAMQLLDDVVTSSGNEVIITPRAATREEARKLEREYTEKLRKRFKNRISFEQSSGDELPPAPAKTFGKIAFYKPKVHVKLGLDLQGGSHLVLQVRRSLFEFKFEKPVGKTREEQDMFLVRLRDLLAKDGFTDVGVKVKEDSPDLVDIATQAMTKAQFEDHRDRIHNLLLREFGKVDIVRQEGYYQQGDILTRTVDIVRRRVDTLGVSEPIIQPQGQSQIIVELPGIDDPKKAIATIGTTAMLEFRHPPEKYKPQVERTATGREVTKFVTGDDNTVVPNSVVYNESQPIRIGNQVLTGRNLKPNATVGMDPTEGPAVHFEFDSFGRKAFGEFTRKNVGKYLAIFLDEKPISCPVIKTPITGGQGQISGGFETIEEARDLMQLLNAGALPVPLDIVENRTVSATLGADSIRKSLVAGIVGLVLVVAFMISVYRLPGVIADVALGIYCVLLLAIMVVLNATLTLPGIAGFIMSIGISVDTNILVFERMKEEFRTDKTFKSAIQAGFNRAWTAILDSHVTTLLGAAVLFYYGTGPVKGFAVTLGLGVLASLFTAFMISRVLVYSVANTGLAKLLPLWNAPRHKAVA